MEYIPTYSLQLKFSVELQQAEPQPHLQEQGHLFLACVRLYIFYPLYGTFPLIPLDAANLIDGSPRTGQRHI